MLTHNQKIAFASIIIEMANVDGSIDIRECAVVNRIFATLAIDAETFIIAKEITLPTAIKVMDGATAEAKLLLAKMLVEVIDADNRVDDAEIRLLNTVAAHLGLDNLV
ncbi:MAG: hypothetical protein Q4B68_06320 [Bacteroidales bacterium]|nr:hypothetical protein [Bacteroidales bacterium]